MHVPKQKNKTAKATYSMIPIIGHSGKEKTIKTVKGSAVAWGFRGRCDE